MCCGGNNSSKNSLSVDLDNIVAIDINSGPIIEKYAAPPEEIGMMNDIAIDKFGKLYITD